MTLPPPGLTFYYAIVDAQAFADSRADAFQADNATDSPAGFPLVALPQEVKDSSLDPALRPELDNSARALPLPLLQVEEAPDSGTPLVPSAYEPIPSQPLPEATQDVPAQDRQRHRGRRHGHARSCGSSGRAVFAQTGAAKYLVEIQTAYLQPKDWKGAINALNTVLRLTLDDRTAARARFYLGESWGYLKNYREAFVDFLSARDSYPEETKPFLEALFSLLASEPN